MDFFFVQSIISYFLRSICLRTHVHLFFSVSLLNCRTKFSVQHVRTYVSFKHGRLLHTYTRIFTWTRTFFCEKRTTGYVRTTGTGTGVKRSVFYELYRIYIYIGCLWQPPNLGNLHTTDLQCNTKLPGNHLDTKIAQVIHTILSHTHLHK